MRREEIGSSSPVRVLIVDDSAVVRRILHDRLSAHPAIRVVGTAGDPYQAREILEREEIDVVTLDIEMPRMDGLTFLRHLMRSLPLPVIMVSSLTDRASQASLEALALGAVDLVLKPEGAGDLEEMAAVLAEKILTAATVDRTKLTSLSEPVLGKASKTSGRHRPAVSSQLMVIGASTGGPQALEVLFRGFPEGFPPTLVAIHMPERFTKSYAQRLNDSLPLVVKEAENGESLSSGTIYIAPGNYHLTLRGQGAAQRLRVSSGPKVMHQRPSVDVLFESAAETAGRNVTGVLLTGMGRDGAAGLLAIRRAGGFTIAQDEASCMVFGMPREAIALGAAAEVLPLSQIASRLTGGPR